MIKKFICLLGCVAPAVAMAGAFQSYSQNYTLNAKGASGTLKKTQTITGNTYNITSSMTLEKFFISKNIVQQALGSFDKNGNLIPQSYSVNNNGALTYFSLQSNQFDPLDLVLWITNGLSNGVTIFSSQNVLYGQANPSVVCAVTSSASPATHVSCPSSDGSLTLNYSFSQDGTYTMLAVNIIENGTQTLSATINNE